MTIDSLEPGPAADRPADAADIFVRMYYEHQYDRLQALESQRLTLTVIVVGTSAAAFALNGSGDQSSIVNSAVVPVIVAAFNLFAIVYIVRMAGLIGVHEKRAKRILERYARPIYDLDRGLPFPSKNRFGGRSNIHLYVHVAIAAIAILLLIARALLF
jgi:hypothetical protein